MKIINRTRWKTEQLRAIAQVVAEQEFDSHDRRQLVIEIRYGAKRAGGVGGKGQLGHSGLHPRYRSWIYVNQPEYYLSRCRVCGEAKRSFRHAPTKVMRYYHAYEPTTDIPRLDSVELAYVIAHEFQHNKGRNHRKMHPRYMGKEPGYFEWAKAYVVEPEDAVQPEGVVLPEKGGEVRD